MTPSADPAFRADVLAGLARRPRSIPARWFYDAEGSAWFERITQLPEYYPTRTETAILAECCAAVAEAAGPGRCVVEFGSGSSTKTPVLLGAIAPAAYVGIDISGDFLRTACAGLADRFSALPVLPLEADFLRPIGLPAQVSGLPKLGFFPGSTIGNMAPADATDLLRAMRETLGEGAMLLIGMDRIKDPAVLHAAYDDAQGVTAAFNRNLLTRINRELDGTIPVDCFAHHAVWNDTEARVEMHLRATRDMRFTVAGEPFGIVAGETIHTENSHKYSRRSARLLLAAGGWTPVREWSDADDAFAVILAEARAVAPAP